MSRFDSMTDEQWIAAKDEFIEKNDAVFLVLDLFSHKATLFVTNISWVSTDKFVH